MPIINDIQFSIPVPQANSVAFPVPATPSTLKLAEFGLNVGNMSTGASGTVLLTGTVAWTATLGLPQLTFTVFRANAIFGSLTVNALSVTGIQETSFIFVDKNVPAGAYFYNVTVTLNTPSASTGANIVGPISLYGLSSY